jgi:hypothetical protein
MRLFTLGKKSNMSAKMTRKNTPKISIERIQMILHERNLNEIWNLQN